MVYRDAVTHIERMDPGEVELVGRECLNARGHAQVRPALAHRHPGKDALGLAGP
jgi:hypothetical protein